MTLLTSAMWIGLTLGCQAGPDGGAGGSGDQAPSDNDPGINIGDDLIVAPGTLVTLSALAEGDANASSSMTYTWEQVFGSPVDWEQPKPYYLRFIAPTPPRDEPITLLFEVVVSSAVDGSQYFTDTVRVIVSPDADPQSDVLYSVVDDEQGEETEGNDNDQENDNGGSVGTAGTGVPVGDLIADAGDDASNSPNSLTYLDGSGSTLPSGVSTSFEWKQISGPNVELANDDRAIALFVSPDAPDGTQLVFRLQLDDTTRTSADDVMVTVSEGAGGGEGGGGSEDPVNAGGGVYADAGPDSIHYENTLCDVDGSKSYSSSGLPLTYQWTQISGPYVYLNGSKSKVATFISPAIAEAAEEVELRLTVTDGITTDEDTVKLAILDVDSEGGEQLPEEDPVLPPDDTGDGEPVGEGEDDPYIPPVPVGTNVALNKPYTMTHDPNYSLTESTSDAWELTDGLIYSGTGKLWVQAMAVGWGYIYEPVGVTVDLGDVYPIDGVTFDSGGGDSGAFLPATVQAWVSDDGIAWHYLTTLSTEAVSQKSLVQHQYVKDGLASRGRYVAFYMLPSGSNMYCDEVEVISGGTNPESVEFATAATDIADLPDAVYDRSYLDVEITASNYLISIAEDSLNAHPDSTLSLYLAALADIREDVLATPVRTGTSREQGLPFTPLDEQTCVTVGGFFAGLGFPRMQMWEYNDYSRDLQPFDRPEDGQEDVALEAHMMVNEHEHVSVVITNNSVQTLSVTLSESGPSNGPAFTFHEASYFLAAGYQYLPDVLPVLENNILEVPPGMTTEVWVSLDSKGVAPGNYSFTVTATSSLGDVKSAPLTITVYDPVMPDNPEYFTYVFAYFLADYIQDYPDKVAEDLREHYSNVHVIKEVPAAYFNNDGVGVVPDHDDFENLDKAVALRPEVRFWILSVNFVDPPMNVFPGSDDPEVEAVFKDWVEIVRDHLALLGVDKSEWGFLIIDEPVDTQWEDYIKPLATWVKETDPEILIYQNWNNSTVEDLVWTEGEGLVDVFVPTHTRVKIDPDTRALVADLGSPSGKYDSGSAPDKDPYIEYRLSHWYSWDWGMQSNGKWTYIDFDHDIWNDYVGSIQAMVYPSDSEPITSRRWESWRDGIEDYELMRLLKEAADSTGDDELESLLVDVPADIFADTTDPSILEVGRLSILQALSP